MSVATVLRLTSTALSVLVALCFLNRPRFWWQEVVCNGSLYLLPVLAFSFVCNVKHLSASWRDRTLAVIGVLASSYALYFMLSQAMPYLRYDRWIAFDSAPAQRLRLLFVDDCPFPERRAKEMLQSYQPEVVVAVGAARDAFRTEGEALAYRRDFDGEQGVLVESSLVLEDRGVPNLGFNGRPGGVVGVKLSNGEAIDLGVINLSSAGTKSEFERNRVSARRLSSYMRNSDATRIAIGNFYATPFSQLTSVFTGQARLRSLWYGKGIVKTYDMNSPYSYFLFSHGFVSRDVAPARVERLTVPGCSLAGLFAELVVVKPEPQGLVAHGAPESTMDDLE